MQINNVFISAVLSATALAAPVSMMATVGDWTIESLQRVCNAADTSCTWTFGVHPSGQNTTACTLVVTNSGNTPASQSSGGPATCGPYTVTSGWSGQFGPGFTTLAVVDYAAKYILYPAYTDAQVEAGTVVTPDQSYTPVVLA